MTDESQDELRARFEQRRDRDRERPERTTDAVDSDEPDDAYDTADTDEPDREDKTRDRKQYSMYLLEEDGERLNGLYERLDAKSKLAGKGEVRKNKDFFEELVDLAAEHEDDLAERLGITMEER